MSVTRANIEAEIISSIGAKLTQVGLDGVTVDGTNSDLSGALANALRGVGITPSSSLSVSDSDLSGLGSDNIDEFLDRAILRLWYKIQGNIDTVDIQTGTRRHSYGQIADQARDAINRLEEEMRIEYGVGVGSLSGGVISLDFQSRHDDEISEV